MKITTGVAAACFLCACATTSESQRVVLLESNSYRCGAEEGLGCGLAIAPVLASIDGIDGVAESSASWDGNYFRIELEPGADSERVTREATAMLEGNERCCLPGERVAQGTVPDRWFDSEGTRELSRYEAGVLAKRFTSEIALDALLVPKEAERVESILRAELERAFERAHAAGGGVYRLFEELPKSRADFEEKLDFLTPKQRKEVAACLDRFASQD